MKEVHEDVECAFNNRKYLICARVFYNDILTIQFFNMTHNTGVYTLYSGDSRRMAMIHQRSDTLPLAQALQTWLDVFADSMSLKDYLAGIELGGNA